MAIKGGRKHLKSIAAPRPWPILRKHSVWTTKAKAGKHNLERGMPLITILRDILKCAKTRKEGIKIIKNKDVLVDGKIVKEPKYSVGFMDVVSLPKSKKNYRVTFTKRGKLALLEIPSAESKFKLCKIEDKTVIKKGTIQLNLHDGRAVLLDKDSYKVGDTVMLEIPKQKIVEHFKMEKGHTAYIIAGKHAGEIGKIKEIKEGTMTRKALVVFEKGAKTIKEHVFVIGKEKSAITTEA